MSTSSDVCLGVLRLRAQQESDLENNPFVATSEWNSYLSDSYKSLYDMLIAAYDNNYYFAQPYSFTTGNAQFYALPDGTPAYQNTVGSTAAKFYKLLGVDLQYSASPTGFITLKKVQFIERNKYAFPNIAVNWNGYTNLKYMIQGNSIMFLPTPMGGQNVKLWYAPVPTSLQFQLPCGTTLSNPTVTMSDTTGLTAGMDVDASNFATGTTVLSVASTSAVLSSNALSTKTAQIISFWNDATTIDGVAGWEEYVIVDAAIKAMGKQESDVTLLAGRRQVLVERIEAMAEARDAGQAFHTSDVLGSSAGFGDIGGWGSGWGDY